MSPYYIVRDDKQLRETIPVRVFKGAEKVRGALQPLRWRILNELSMKPSYAREIARSLRVNEQKIYYHIRALKELGLIRVTRQEKIRGTVANYYEADSAALAVLPDCLSIAADELSLQPQISQECRAFLGPILTKSGVEALIVVGSPDAHGEFKSRARCGHFSADLALFLGSMAPLTRRLATRLDTEIGERELKENLIVVGGPRVNTVATRLNESLPIRFKLDQQITLVSTISGKRYYDEENGVVAKISNPFSPGRVVLLLAGIGNLGTRASVTAFVKHLEEITRGNILNRSVPARVVVGLDLDSDGVIDEADFME